MPKLHVIVGLPGSGKTTYALKLRQSDETDNTLLLSSDDYRASICGTESDQTQNALVFQTLYKDAVQALNCGKDVIIDATNCTLKGRQSIFREVVSKCKERPRVWAHVIATPIQECMNQDTYRERRVGNDVIMKYARSFQVPQKFEGFDRIKIVYHDTLKLDPTDYTRLREKMDKFDQQNFHHKYTLGQHSGLLAAHYPAGSIEWIAGCVHDVGKLYTKRVDEQGVAHYYNHDSIGAYKLMCHPMFWDICDEDEWLEVLFYVNYHMRAHKDLKQPKAEKKYRNIFGDDRFDRLIEFGKYDMFASGTYYEQQGEKHD